MAALAGTLYLRSRLQADGLLVQGELYQGVSFFSIMHVLFDGITEMTLMVRNPHQSPFLNRILLVQGSHFVPISGSLFCKMGHLQCTAKHPASAMSTSKGLQLKIGQQHRAVNNHPRCHDQLHCALQSFGELMKDVVSCVLFHSGSRCAANALASSS